MGMVGVFKIAARSLTAGVHVEMGVDGRNLIGGRQYGASRHEARQASATPEMLIR